MERDLLQDSDSVERPLPSKGTGHVEVEKLQVIPQINRPLKNDTAVKRQAAAAFTARGWIHMSSGLKVEKYPSANSSAEDLMPDSDAAQTWGKFRQDKFASSEAAIGIVITRWMPEATSAGVPVCKKKLAPSK